MKNQGLWKKNCRYKKKGTKERRKKPVMIESAANKLRANKTQ